MQIEAGGYSSGDYCISCPNREEEAKRRVMSLKRRDTMIRGLDLELRCSEQPQPSVPGSLIQTGNYLLPWKE